MGIVRLRKRLLTLKQPVPLLSAGRLTRLKPGEEKTFHPKNPKANPYRGRHSSWPGTPPDWKDWKYDWAQRTEASEKDLNGPTTTAGSGKYSAHLDDLGTGVDEDSVDQMTVDFDVWAEYFETMYEMYLWNWTTETWNLFFQEETPPDVIFSPYLIEMSTGDIGASPDLIRDGVVRILGGADRVTSNVKCCYQRVLLKRL